MDESKPGGQGNLILMGLDQQIAWYDRKSAINQSWFKRLKILEILVAALIPFIAGLSWSSTFAVVESDLFVNSAILTGLLGVGVVVLESLQSIYQFHSNWITYRSTYNELVREKYLWMSGAGPYASAEDPDMLLADRVESIISSEQAKWISDRAKIDRIKVIPQVGQKMQAMGDSTVEPST